VGIGLLPVPLRNVGLTAMELATLARLFPGRLKPGVGHGVLDWMAQVGARAQSPMTLLQEYVSALRELLHGQIVTTAGRYVQLDNVRLDWPPEDVPPLLVGAVGPRTVELAGRLGDGVILTGDTTLDQLRTAVTRVHAGHQAGQQQEAGGDKSRHESVPKAAPEVVVFLTVADQPPAAEIAAQVAEYTAAGATTVALLSVGDNAPRLADFASFVGREVGPLIG
jgi:alkanesulfonate monooxygenase SsuD/methylene tetrahydromethanopterin reductase-like flavin-dependent oxidoreductase (luciferase family)